MLHRLLVLALLAACGSPDDGKDPKEKPQAVDADLDGVTEQLDCDDADPARYPGAEDTVGDGVDNNCDGADGVDADGDGAASVESGGTDCDDADPTVQGEDADGDGAAACVDCDDGDPDRAPGFVEDCNGIDDDCDGTVDRDGDGVGLCSVEHSQTDRVDVLLVIDNSCSMSEEQSQLAGSAPVMMDAFLGSGVDYHIGVVSTDMNNATQSGQLREVDGVRWVDVNTPNATATLSTMILYGTAGSASEKGRDAAYAAVEVHDVPGGTNNGFTRADADLDVLVLSDENDGSDGISPLDWLTWFDGLKGPGFTSRFHSIVSPNPVCPTAAAPGDLYTGLTLETDGITWSICSGDYSPPLADIAALHDPAGRDSFTLPVDADPDSLAAETTDAVGTVVAYGSAELVYDPVEWTVTLPAPVLPGGSVVLWYAPAP